MTLLHAKIGSIVYMGVPSGGYRKHRDSKAKRSRVRIIKRRGDYGKGQD